MAGSTLRFGVVGLSSDHVWGMGDGLTALPEFELLGAADRNPELRDKAGTGSRTGQAQELTTTFADAVASVEPVR
jgi:hypothetical protein